MNCEAGEDKSEEGRRFVRDEPLASSCRCFLNCSRCKARGRYSGTKVGIWLDLCILRNSETTHKIYETFALHQ